MSTGALREAITVEILGKYDNLQQALGGAGAEVGAFVAQITGGNAPTVQLGQTLNVVATQARAAGTGLGVLGAATVALADAQRTVAAEGQKSARATADLGASAQAAAAGVETLTAAQREAAAAGDAMAASVARAASLSTEQLARLKANLAESEAARRASKWGAFEFTVTQAGWEADAAQRPGTGRLDVTTDRATIDRAFRGLTPAAADAGEEAADAFVRALTAEIDRDFAAAGAVIKEEIARGLLTPAEAAQRAREAAQAYNTALIAVIDQQPGGADERSQAIYTGLASKLKDVREEGTKAKLGFGQLRESVTSLAASAAGVPGPLGTIASVLLNFSAGGAVTIGVLAGAGLIAGAWHLMTKDARAAEERLKGVRERLQGIRNETEAARIHRLQIDTAEAERKVAELDRKIRALKNAAASIGVGDENAAASIAQQGTQLDALQRQRRAVAGEAAAGRQELERRQAAKEIADLSAVLRAEVATNAERARAVELVKQMRAEMGKPFVTTERRAELAGMIESLTKPVEKAEKALDQLVEKQRAVREQFASATAAFTTGQGDNLEAQIAKLVSAAREAKLGQDEISKLVGELRAAAAAKLAREGEALAEQLREQLVRGTKTAVDDAQLVLAQFDKSIAEKRKAGVAVDEGLARQVRQLLTESVATTREAEALAKQLERVQGLVASQEYGQAQALLIDQLQQQQAIVNDTTRSEEARKAAAERVKQIYGEIGGALEAQANEAVRAARAEDERVKNAREIESSTEKLAGKIGAAASLAAGLATAFAGANSEITRGLAGVAAMAGGVSDLLAKARQADGLGNLLSTGGGVVSAAGALGGIISGGGAIVAALSSLFDRKPSAEELAQQRAVEANTKALQELATKLGDLALTATGQQRDRAAAAAARFAATFRGEPGGLPLPLPTNDPAEILRIVLRDAGITFEDLAEQAKAFGIEVQRNGAGVTAFLDAVRSTSAGFRELQERLDVLGATAPERLRATLEELSTIQDTATQRTGETARHILESFDLATEAGREAAVEYVRARFTEGQITADVAKQIIAVLLNVEDAAASAVDGLQRLADELRDISALGRLLGTSATDQLRQVVEAYAKAFPQFAAMFVGLLDGIDLATEEGFAKFQERVRDFVQSLLADGVLTDEERQIVDALGVILDGAESILGQALRAGETAVDAAATMETAISKAVSIVEAAAARLNSLRTDSRRMGLSPEQAAQQEGAVFNDPGVTFSNGQRAVDVLGMYDFADPAQRAAALSAAQQLYPLLTGADKEWVGQYIDWLQSIPPEVGAATAGAVPNLTLPAGIPDNPALREIGEGAANLTERTGTMMGDLLASIDIGVRSLVGIETTISDKVGALLAAVTGQLPPLVAPQAPPGFWGAGGGGVSIELTLGPGAVRIGDVHVGGGASAATAAEVARVLVGQLGPELLAFIAQELGQQSEIIRLLRGSIASRHTPGSN